MMKLFKLLTIFFYFGVVSLNVKLVKSEHILALAPFGGKSHWNFMQGILRALTDHGHEVTVFTPFPDGNKENYTEIDISKETRMMLRLDINVIEKFLTSYTDFMDLVSSSNRNGCKDIFKNDIIRSIIGVQKTKFDVVMMEIMSSECMAYMSTKLNIPLIYVTPPPLISYVERSILGHYPNPAVVSHTLADHHVPETFSHRIGNTILFAYTSFLLQFKLWSASRVDQQPFDLVEPVKPSIVFANAHYITDAPRSLPPNVIQVGGIHLSPPKTIPEDILEFIENSPKGVIIFTLGSIITLSSFPKHVQEIIIEVLGQLPQRVLLKYENELKFDVPKNIMTLQWLPQRDILMHPNIKLFISHGGISGIYEAVDAGIPVLGFPFFFDQSRNLKNLVGAGMAISMDFKAISKDTFKKAILELINDEKYMINAKLVSEQFKDRPMSPAQSVDYWTRYVVRHKGAHHLKSQALNLSRYQYFLLDVIVVLFLVFTLIIYVLYILSRMIQKYFVTKVLSKHKSE